MRILELGFKNLNSLAGEWKINFNHTSFTSDGIFAIIGPTGAGKTTILDALCLALYGRTPRLKSISKTENEIMSRHTGECYAEVTFETQAGRFRCRWSQRRARSRPGGDLQPPRRECANAITNEVLESKLDGFTARVEELTGMDYARFTRSMLLAQGGFTAFLNASPDERAPILEQLTGMEIYSDISKTVHARTVAERSQLERLEAELAGLHLLDEDEERRLEADLAVLEEHNAGILKSLEEQQKALLWLEGLDRLQAEADRLESQKAGLAARFAAFQPQRERLRRAAKALELAGECAGLAALRAAQEVALRQMEGCLAALPAGERRLANSETALRAATDALNRRKEELRTGMQAVKAARDCDLRLREKDAALLALRRDIAARETALTELEEASRASRERLEAGRSALNALDAELRRTAVDKGLVENLTGLRGRFGLLREQSRLLRDKRLALKDAELRREASARDHAAAIDRRARTEAGLAGLAETRENRQSALGAALEGHGEAEWRARLMRAGTRKAVLENTGEALLALVKTRETLASTDGRQKAVTEEEAALRARLSALQASHEAGEAEREALEHEMAHLALLRSYEQARLHLTDGEPCPLCGALEHPFATKSVREPDGMRERAEALKQRLRREAETLLALQGKAASLHKEREMLTERRKDAEAEAAAFAARLREGLEALGLPTLEAQDSLSDLSARLRQRHVAETETSARAEAALRRAEALQKEIAAAREAWEGAREALALAERDAQGSVHAKAAAEQEADRLRQEYAALAEQHAEARRMALNETAPYGVAALAPDDLDGLLAELETRRNHWLARTARRETLTRDIARQELETGQRETQLAAAREERDRRRAALLELRAERDALENGRRPLPGGAAPDAEEARLENAVREAEARLEEARRQAEAVRQDLAGLRRQTDMLRQATAERASHMEPLERDFRRRLELAGFADEADYRAACLSEEERERLRQEEQELRTEQTELDARRRDKAAQLAAERRRNVTPLSREQVAASLATLRENARRQQEAIGGIRQKMEENRNLKEACAARAAAIAAQRREYGRWRTLHDLIGSESGKKYRNFVQALTFEIMIDHANRQLQGMSDRYLLIRNTADPLQLDVIDNYQAGEVRSTKNLSGGESFIVSLALALGLSQMASKTVRVDSLFLDEGFGTLDEEALDTALETLAGLQREGKLIGVISHVAALKERIGTQIRVTPVTGGRSVLHGPGCTGSGGR